MVIKTYTETAEKIGCNCPIYQNKKTLKWIRCRKETELCNDCSIEKEVCIREWSKYLKFLNDNFLAFIKFHTCSACGDVAERNIRKEINDLTDGLKILRGEK